MRSDIVRSYMTWLIILTVTVSSCKSRLDSGLAGARVENDIAWFTGGDRPINVCIRVSDAVVAANHAARANITIAYLSQAIGMTYTAWYKYMVSRGVQPYFPTIEADPVPADSYQSWGALNHKYYLEHAMQFPTEVVATPAQRAQAFPGTLNFIVDCSKADLEFNFGTTPSFAVEDRSSNESTLGYVAPDQRSPKGSWRRGAVIVAGTELISYEDALEPTFVLMHEWGHILGVPHVEGTIMDPEELRLSTNSFRALRGLNPAVRTISFFSAYMIDRWRNLMLCQRLDCSYQGSIFGVLDAEVQTSPDSDELTWILDMGSDAAQQLQVAVDQAKAKGVKNGNIFDWTSTVPEKPQPIVKIFRRPDNVSVPELFHESRSIEMWTGKSNLVKLLMNTSKPGESPIQFVGDCKDQHVNLFSSMFGSGSSIVFSDNWIPTMDVASPLSPLEAYRACAGDRSLIYDLLATDLKQLLRERAQFPVDLSAWHFYTEFNGPVNVFPKQETWCTQMSFGEFCLWRRDNFAFFTTQYGGKYYVGVFYQYGSTIKNGPYSEVWKTVMYIHDPKDADPSSRRPFLVRLALDQDMKQSPSVVGFTMDQEVSGSGYAWLPFTKGTMKKAP